MEDDRHQIVTELAPLGSVSDALADIEDEVAPGHQLAILQQICSGMAALASEGLVHRDLALRNVLLFVFDPDDPTAAGVCVKICDFGLTVNTYGGTHATVAGGPRPIRWMAPESLDKSRYSEKSDVFSFGVTAWELLTGGRRPHRDLLDDPAVMAHVIGGGTLGRPVECPSPGYDALWAALEPCWARRPRDRPRFAALCTVVGQLPGPGGGGGGGDTRSVGPLQAPGTVVAAASVAAADLFVFNATGLVVTAMWLFENGHSKADCTPAVEAAAAVRSQVRAELATARAEADELEAALAVVEQALADVAGGAERAAAAIGEGINATLAQGIAAMTAAAERRREALLAAVSDRRRRGQSVGAARLAALRAAQAATQVRAGRGAELEVLGDLELLQRDGQHSVAKGGLPGSSVDGEAASGGGGTATLPDETELVALRGLEYRHDGSDALRDTVAAAFDGVGSLVFGGEQATAAAAAAAASGENHCELLLRELLPEGADVNQADEHGRTALWHAAHRGELAVTMCLVDERGASTTIGDSGGRSPLHAAAGYDGADGRLEVVQWLAGHGGSVTQPDNDGRTPLSVAAWKGHNEVVQWLAGHGGSVTQPDNHGRTPLFVAAQEGHLEVVQWLAGHGGSVTQRDISGHTPLSVAGQKKHTAVVRFLKQLLA